MNDKDTIIGTILALLTDDNGNYLVGIENGITPEKVLAKLGMFPHNTDPFIWYKQYNAMGVNIAYALKKIMQEGFVAGGMSRNPTYYFIARPNNSSEEGLILKKKIKNTKGRLKAIAQTGKNLLGSKDVKKIGGAIRLLQHAEDSLAENPSNQKQARIG